MQSDVGRLIVALGIIACVARLLQSRGEPLQERVRQLENEVRDFWAATDDSVATNSRIIDLAGVTEKLKGLQGKVQALPEIPPELTQRIMALYDAVLIPYQSGLADQSTFPAASLGELSLEQHADIGDCERDIRSYLDSKNKFLKVDLERRQRLVLAQVSGLYKFRRGDDGLFVCLLRLRGIGKKLSAPEPLSGPMAFHARGGSFGGLDRGWNNSCYLATALQLFRVIGAVREKFDPSKNPLQDQDKAEIQRIINEMLVRMNQGETIPAQEGIRLQELINRARVNKDHIAGMYDAGQVTASLLCLMGFEFPKGQHSIIRSRLNGEVLSRKDAPYSMVPIPVPGTIDVGHAVMELTLGIETVVQENTGNIKHFDQVTALPELMVIEFAPGGRLVNYEQFDDPFDGTREYKLVFGMEHYSMHWVAHVLCADGQWMTANDATVSAMTAGALQNMCRGYYIRQPKVVLLAELARPA